MEWIALTIIHNSEMKKFFTYVREKNPDIDFHVENAGSDGVEISEFDYFSGVF